MATVITGDGEAKPADYDEQQQGMFWEKREEHVEFDDGQTAIQISKADYFKLMEKLVDLHSIPHKKHKK